jgi:hypothetical protein
MNIEKNFHIDHVLSIEVRYLFLDVFIKHSDYYFVLNNIFGMRLLKDQHLLMHVLKF